MTYLSSVPRAPWYIQRNSLFSQELMRIFNQGLTRDAKRIGVKLLDYIFYKDGDDVETGKPVKVVL